MPEISVVIPTLNEVRALPQLLADLEAQVGIALEVIVCDGGSTDGTASCGRFRAVRCARPHRAEQLNAGAKVANSPWLLFLHADSRLTDPAQLSNALRVMKAQPARTAGHFALRFVGPTSELSAFRFLERKSQLNRPNTTNGDQGMLIARAFFEELGGFDTRLAYLEDQRFAEKVRSLGRWITLPGRLETSTRRFATEGFAARYLAMAVMMGAHQTGRYDLLTPSLYAANPTGELDLQGLLAAIREMEGDLERAADVWFAAGRFARQNVWQVALLFDTLRHDSGSSSEPYVEAYDRLIAPHLDRSSVDAALSVALASIFLLALPAVWTAKHRILRAGA